MIAFIGHMFVAVVRRAEAASAAGPPEGGGLSGDLLGVLLLVIIPSLLLAGAGLMALRWWRKREAERRSIPPEAEVSFAEMVEESPEDMPQTLEEAAFRELENARALYEAGKSHEFANAVAILVKRYITDVYHVKVADATTSQILANLPQSLSDGVVDHVGEILHTCDTLRFPRHRASRGELERLYQSAFEFLELHQTIEMEMEAEEEDDPEAPLDEDELQEIFRRYFPR